MDSRIPAYLESPPDHLPQPPTVTRVQELPFHQLTWENFERLCLRLIRREGEIYQCFFYGERGQKQRGIDIIAYAGALSQRRVQFYQCKREEDFGPLKVKGAVDKFLEGKWDPKPSTFVICSSLSLRSADVQEEILAQADKLGKEGVTLTIWDSESLSGKLKEHPDLVDDFFGRPWVEAFNGLDAVSHLADRLSGQDVVALRSRLFILYRTLFERHDPGLSRSPLERPVSFLARYAPPDIAEHRAVMVTMSSPSGVAAGKMPDEAEQRDMSLSFLESGTIRREHPISQREFTIERREAVLQWLPKSSRSVVLGEPGAGKSALLRFITLSLLNPDFPDADLAASWGERLPIWISFSAWTRVISQNETISLEDFLFTWLHQHSADDLKPLLSQALKDHRLLLLIDGLDERYSEEAGKVALDRLDALLAGKDIPAILTSRPAGYERVRRPSGEWRHGRLLELNDLQLQSIAHFWFSWLGSLPENSDSAAKAAAIQAAEKQTGDFLSQLDAAPHIRDLARVPLLLLLLVEVTRSKGRIPEHRIKAYDMMVEHLIAVHPALRRQAAGMTRSDETIPTDDIKEAMARLALRIQEDHGGGYAPIETCQEVFVKYFSDQVDGPGYQLPDARKKARQLVQMAQEGLGLLVERGINELGFIYLALQEYLAALAIARKPDVDQEGAIEQHWKDPRWREVILALFGVNGVLKRDRRQVERLLDHLRRQPQSELEQLRLWPLLSEIVFGEMGLSPVQAGALAEEIMDTVEQCPFPRLRKSLAPMVVQGLRSEYLREAISNRLQIWFPARFSYTRRDLLKGTMTWEPADDLRKTLLVAINDENAGCRIAAAHSLAKVFSGDRQIAADLSAHARRAVRPELREAALLALFEGWPNLDGLPQILEGALAEKHPGIRLSAALGRIALGLHNNRDLDVLWLLPDWRNGLDIERRDEIVPAILKGWPHSQKVRKACLEVFRAHANYDREGMDIDHAAAILISMFPGDDKVAGVLAEEIRRGSGHAFGMHSHDVWELLAKYFRRHPLLIEPVSTHLKYFRERYQAIYPSGEHTGALSIAATPELKEDLLASFGKGETYVSNYWTASALVEAWPDDEEVQEFLRKQLDGPPEIAGEVAPFIHHLGFDPAEQRQRLLSIIKNPATPRVWMALETLLRISKPDEEILEAGLTSLGKPRHVYEDQSAKRLLIQAFPADKKVEPLAWELWNDIDGFPGFLSSIYGAHPTFRPILLAAMRTMDAVVRSEIVAALGAPYIPTACASSILKGFLYEQDEPSIRTSAVVSLANHALHDEELQKWLVDALTRETTALGHIYEERRTSAVAGLLRLGKLDVITSMEPPKLYVLRAEKNLPYFREILRNWERIKQSFGEGLFERFYNDPTAFWEIVAPLSSEFRRVRDDLVSYLRDIAGKVVGPNTLHVLAETFPRSDILRETCFETFQSSDFTPDATFVAARLMGQQFGGEADTLGRLRAIERIKDDHDPFRLVTQWRKLLAFCYGWTEALEVKEWIKKPRQEWQGMPWHISLHLHRLSGEQEQLLKDIERILRQNENRTEVHDEEIGYALKLWAGDERNRTKLLPLLDSPDPSLAATTVGLLSTSAPVTGDLRRSLEILFEKELQAQNYPPRVGIDLSVGSLRVLAEAIFDAIG